MSTKPILPPRRPPAGSPSLPPPRIAQRPPPSRPLPAEPQNRPLPPPIPGARKASYPEEANDWSDDWESSDDPKTTKAAVNNDLEPANEEEEPALYFEADQLNPPPPPTPTPTLPPPRIRRPPSPSLAPCRVGGGHGPPPRSPVGLAGPAKTNPAGRGPPPLPRRSPPAETVSLDAPPLPGPRRSPAAVPLTTKQGVKRPTPPRDKKPKTDEDTDDSGSGSAGSANFLPLPSQQKSFLHSTQSSMVEQLKKKFDKSAHITANGGHEATPSSFPLQPSLSVPRGSPTTSPTANFASRSLPRPPTSPMPASTPRAGRAPARPPTPPAEEPDDSGDDFYDDVDTLNAYKWFGERVTRDEASTLVKRLRVDGTFVVRTSTKDPNLPYSLTVIYSGHVYNLNLRKRSDGLFAVGKEKPNEETFPTIPKLIDYFVTNKLSLQSAKGPSGETCLNQHPEIDFRR